jgi:DNA polymerase-4
MNSYFATIEQQINPLLRNKPVIVVPVLSDSTCAIAASSEAKLKGIKTGTKVYEAKKLCPDIICVLASHEIYVQYHKRLFAEVDKYLHVDHIFSIDEGACRLTGKQCNEEEAIKLAERIKLAIRQNVGDYISCSIGIAPNRYLAKIATNIKKPDGLMIIRPEDIPHKLYNLRLRDLPGVGSKTFKRLCLRGIVSVEKLYQLDLWSIKNIWGSIWGEKIWYLLRGADLPLDKVKSNSIGHSQVLAPELRNNNSARNAVLSLLLKAASRLRTRGLYTTNILLCISTADKGHFKKIIKVTQTSDSTILAKALLAGWDELIKCDQTWRIKKVSIAFANLQPESQQLSFDDLIAKKPNPKSRLISESMDIINAKFGKGTISLGHITKKRQAPIIAFRYIPE